MFDFIRSHTKLFQFILMLLVFPSFVFFGIQGYSRFTGGANTAVAKVAGQNITQADWDAAHREQVERLRSRHPDADPKLLDTPQMRRATLDNLVREHVLLATADQLHEVPSDERLRRLFASDPEFASLRDAQGHVSAQMLAAQGMSSKMFAQRLRQELAMRQVVQGVADTAFAPAAAASSALDAFFQQREVQLQRFDPKQYAAKVSPTEAELEKFYKDPANAAMFQAPEQANIEYVVLDVDALKSGVSVSEAELRDYYKINASRYNIPEERRASHILIKVDKNAPADVRAKARAKAESLLAELKKNPGAFAELAKKNSDDTASAQRGGDLDFFGRNAMVKPFEDAAFSLKPGQLSGVVESELGYHIIMITGARGGQTKTFEEVRPQVEDEVRTQLAQKKFAEAAVDFTNMVYEQSDSLKPVVDKYKLPLRTAQGIRRTPVPGMTGPLANAKFLDALFSSDVVRNKRNTDAVETGPNQLASGRVLQYSPAHTVPFAEVKDQVRERVIAQQAAVLARQAGEARLAELKKDPKQALAAAAVTVSRAQAKDVAQPVVTAVLGADASHLPAVVGVDLGDEGYVLARVVKVAGRDPLAADASVARQQYAQAWGDAELKAYYAALKARTNASVKDDVVAAAESSAASSSAK